MVHDVNLVIIVCLIHVLIMVYVHKQQLVTSVHVHILSLVLIVNKVCLFSRCFFHYICILIYLLVISTTTIPTTIATRAPCGGGCACVYTPCPVVVVTNPCSSNPWFDFFDCIEGELYICYFCVVKIWVDVRYKIMQQHAGVQIIIKDIIVNIVC
jgi:hypothetical protein